MDYIVKMIKKATILVGLPGSGKSTYIANSMDPSVWVFSSDNIIENIAFEYGLTYNEAFKDLIAFADKTCRNEFKCAVANHENDLVVDRTNLTIKSRRTWIEPLNEKGYHITVVVFPVPEKDEWERRLNSRPGKTIPDDIIQNMMRNFQFPTVEEGFDDIVVIES